MKISVPIIISLCLLAATAAAGAPQHLTILYDAGIHGRYGPCG